MSFDKMLDLPPFESVGGGHEVKFSWKIIEDDPYMRGLFSIKLTLDDSEG
jgi:hypothetical protein